MKETACQKSICPKCGREYIGYPALSRTDNSTLICPDCGTREALDALSIGPDEQDQILQTIHHSLDHLL